MAICIISQGWEAAFIVVEVLVARAQHLHAALPIQPSLCNIVVS